jgi:hypothetical protein
MSDRWCAKDGGAVKFAHSKASQLGSPYTLSARKYQFNSQRTTSELIMSNTEANQSRSKTRKIPHRTPHGTVDCLDSQSVPSQHRKYRSKLASLVLKIGSEVSASSNSNQPPPTNKHDKPCQSSTYKEKLKNWFLRTKTFHCGLRLNHYLKRDSRPTILLSLVSFKLSSPSMAKRMC